MLIGAFFDDRQTATSSCENKAGRGKSDVGTVMRPGGAKRHHSYQRNQGSCNAHFRSSTATEHLSYSRRGGIPSGKSPVVVQHPDRVQQTCFTRSVSRHSGNAAKKITCTAHPSWRPSKQHAATRFSLPPRTPAVSRPTEAARRESDGAWLLTIPDRVLHRSQPAPDVTFCRLTI